MFALMGLNSFPDFQKIFRSLAKPPIVLVGIHDVEFHNYCQRASSTRHLKFLKIGSAVTLVSGTLISEPRIVRMSMNYYLEMFDK